MPVNGLRMPRAMYRPLEVPGLRIGPRTAMDGMEEAKSFKAAVTRLITVRLGVPLVGNSVVTVTPTMVEAVVVAAVAEMVVVVAAAVVGAAMVEVRRTTPLHLQLLAEAVEGVADPFQSTVPE